MKEFCRKGHMKGSGKRWLAILMSICLIGTMIPISARAETDGTQKSGYEQEEENVSVPQNDTKDKDSVDGEDTADNTSEPGDDPAPSDDEPTCTCSERCTEDHLNSDCPVCGEEGAGLSQCEGKEQTKTGEEQTKPDEKQNAECTCSELCTEDNINTDCPVCGADDTDLYDCKGKPDENDDVIDEETLTITAWEWIDEEEYLDPETGSLALPFANKEHPAYFDDITAFLPTQILATVENTEDTEAEEEDEAITLGDWSCDNYPEDGAYTGSYTFTATLPEGYALSDEAEALEVLVELGGAQMYESAEGVTVGAFTVTGGTQGEDYTYAGGVLTIKKDTPITIANTDPTTPTTDRIMVASGISANITLAGVNIDVSSLFDKAAFKIANYSTGNVTITLADGSENKLISGNHCAGLQKNDSVEGIGKLTIQGGTNGTGTLTATGGEKGAGIGGGDGYAGSTITISSGTVTASGGSKGAGIGGGDGYAGSTITISGGTVTATGGFGGAGIGGGYGASGSNIEISGGTVTANGGAWGAGIGGGEYAAGSNITISDGTVTAKGGSNGAGIGGGYQGSGSDITISSGSVKAVVGENENAIGGGFNGGGAVTPTLADDKTPVYLLEISNPDSAEVLIDGVSYTPVNHKAVDSNDGNLYAYLTGAEHRVQVGNKTIFYTFDSDSSTFAVAPLTVYATNGGALTYGTDYTYENNVLTIKTSTSITIANTDQSTATTDRIEVESGVSANITLAGVNINVSSSEYTAAFKIADDSTGNVTITLADGSENTLISSRNCAGLQKNGDTLKGTLTIQGGTNGTGELTATGGMDGAGIGGGSGGSGSNITIKGGTVTAISYWQGAGIGGGNGKNGSNITIIGGTVTANGGEWGAGIGGGTFSSGSNITIKGGTVTATGGSNGAGIGGGYQGSGSDIAIEGGTVTATGDDYGAGIGGGYQGSGSNITISGGTVTANGGYGGAGIGGGYQGSGSNITISGGTVTAKGGSDGAGIGGGDQGSGSDITISGGSVKAVGAGTNDIGGNGAVTPTLADGTTEVYLLEIPNSGSEAVQIDGVSYTPVNHKAVYSNDGNLYAYLTGAEHRVQVGNKTIFYTFDSENSTFAVAPLIAYATNGGTLTYDTDYTYENNVLTIKSATPITIANKDPNTATTDRIEVASGVSANITLDGVNIDVSSSDDTAAFKIADHSYGNVTITLADGSENTLESGRNCAGLQKKDNTSTGTLTIQGGTEGTGRLTATGRENGAGIGGGCGDNGTGTSSGIKISGGTVTAKGGKNGAGIGGGWNGSGSNITISGGTVTATGGLEGAGIGGGWNRSGSNITISGGTVTATGGLEGAGIGGGWEGSGSNIEISGGSVKASGANKIGGGSRKEAVTPTNGTTPVYLFEIANDSGAAIMINNNAYPAEHTYYDFESSQYVTEKKIYAYLPAKTVTEPNVVIVGTETTKYIYDNSKWRIVPTVTAPTPNELAYTGEDQALVAAGTTSGGTMVYSLREYDMYTETIPTGTGAGTYTVWYKVEGNEDYAATLPASVSVTIAKASTVITNADTVRNQSTVYGSGEFTAPVAEVTGTVTYKVGETTYDAEQLKTYLAGKNVSDSPVTVEYTFKPTDTTNYKEVTGTISFTITQATPTISWDMLSGATWIEMTSMTVNYTGSEIAPDKLLVQPTVTLVNSEKYNGEISYSYRVQGSSDDFTSGLPTEIGTYEVKASITADGNYKEAAGTVTLTVNWFSTGAAATLTDQGGNSLNGNDWWAQSVTFTAPTGFTISNSVDGSYGTSFVYDTQTGADGITVTYYLKNSKGEIAQKTATVRIDRTAPTWPENGGITIKANWWKSLLNTISFGLFYKDATLDVKASAADDLSGVASYYYYVDTKGSTMVLSSDELATKTFTEVAGSGTQTLTGLSADGKYVVYAYAVDAAGNKSDYVCTNGVVLDTTAPTIGTITTPSKEALTLTDTSAKISFTGSEAGTCFYMVKKSDETAPASIADFAEESAQPDDKGMSVWKANTGVSSVEMTTEAKQITLSNLSPNTEYNLYLAAVDKAGNSIAMVERNTFTTCKTMPTITTNPSISGIYGQKVEEMTRADGVAKVGSEEIRGTWELTDSNKANIPEVGTTDTYQVTFKPDASYNDNYDTVIVPVKPTVSKRAITVTATDKTKTYGQANPAFTYAITEGTLVGTDTKEALGITLTCAANASSPVKAGGYAITGTSDSANYQVTVIPGVLIITKADPTITAPTGYTKTYGDIKFFLEATDNSAEAGLQYAVTESKDPNGSVVEKDAVVTVDARGYVTIKGAGTAKITASLPETANYNAASREILITVNKAANAPNMPGTTISAANRYETVGAVPLPTGWAWKEADRNKGLTVNTPVQATAEYTGADKENYENITVTVGITRSDCDHVAGEILYTGSGEQAPTCTVDGLGHRECTSCGNPIESGIIVKAAHSFSSTWTIDVPATTTSEGSKSHHCTVCDAKNDITLIPKLPGSSGGGSGNSGGSSDGGSGSTEDSGNTGGSTDTGNGNTNPGTVKPTVTPGTPNQGTNPAPGENPAPGTGNNNKPGSKPVTNTGETTETPFIKGENGKEGWDAIRDEVNQTQEGKTVTVDMNGSTVIPGNVLDEIKGKDITIVFDMGGGITWSVNGQSITADRVSDIDFTVKTGTKTIPVDIINNVTGERYSTQISLSYDGEFGFTAVLSINVDAKNAGLYANLFYYNEKTGELEFICADEIAADGTAELVFTHASDYAIVIDTEPMDKGADEADGDKTEVSGTGNDSTQSGDGSTQNGTEAADSTWNPLWLILIGAVVIVIGLGVFLVVKKKKPGDKER